MSLLVLVLLGIELLTIEEIYKNARGKVPYVRSAKKTWALLLNEIEENPAKVFYDLGCGDGSLLFLVEKEKKMKAIGYDIGLYPYFFSRVKKMFKNSKVKFFKKDIFESDISDADFVFLYLLPPVVERFRKEIMPKLKNGAIIICNTFSLENMTPYKTIDVLPEKKLSKRLYFYKV